MVTKRSRTGGFTLTEAMIVLAILGAVVMMGPTLITQLTRFFLLGQTRIELQRDARAAINLITRDLRQADSGSIRIDQASSQPYYSRLRMTTEQGRTIYYWQNGTSLMQTVGTRHTILTKNLRYMAFTFPHSDDMTIVSVALTLEKYLYQGRTKALHMASEKVQVMN